MEKVTCDTRSLLLVPLIGHMIFY